MTSQTCCVPGCDLPRRTSVACPMHYERKRRHGSYDYKRMNDAERFCEKIAFSDECWLWTGTVNGGNGRPSYGQFHLRGRKALAHRLAYELCFGPIPPGLVLDHLCRTPKCVRPDHREPVSNRTTVITRGTGAFAEKARATHCKHGHEFTPENTRIRRDSAQGTRTCKQCQRDRARTAHGVRGHHAS